MWAALGDLKQAVGSRQFWSSTIRLAVLISFGVAALLIAFTAMIVVLPLALAGGLALHLYLRHKLRQATVRRPRSDFGDLVIDGEYTVIDRR